MVAYSDTFERPQYFRLYKDLWHLRKASVVPLCWLFALLLGSQILKLLAPWFAGKAINALRAAAWERWKKRASGCGRVCRDGRELVLHGPGRIVERNIAIRVRERVAGACSISSWMPTSVHEQHHSGESAIACSKAAVRCTILRKVSSFTCKYRPDHWPGAGVVLPFRP